MKEDFDKLLSVIDVEIAKIDLYGNDIIETSLSIVRHLQSIITGLRNELQTYTFPTQEDEIRFFKVQKPELLGRLLYFHKICRIEMQCPNGSNEVIRKHLIAELDNLTYFFNRNLDFYQYYRSHSTMYDKYYFVRGKADIRLCADSAQFDKDPNFSTGYDYTVAKILANEMLRIYLNQRLQLLEKKQLTNDIKISLSDFKLKWTGTKSEAIEWGYGLFAAKTLNYGNSTIKEVMAFVETAFDIELGDYYRTYLSLKNRKKDRTAFFTFIMEQLQKRMDDDL